MTDEQTKWRHPSSRRRGDTEPRATSEEVSERHGSRYNLHVPGIIQGLSHRFPKLPPSAAGSIVSAVLL